MAQILFKNQTEVSNNWLFYIENEAKSLAQLDEIVIQNYIDSEIFNPELQSYLSSDSVATMLEDTKETESLHLNVVEGINANILPDWLQQRFKKLKTKVKQIFCKVVRGIQLSNSDTKEIIKSVILDLIPAFAGGLPAAVLPIVIGLVAYLMKYGIEKVCPV
jgi:hypothetical protein